MKVEFLKARYYKKKLHKVGDIVDMTYVDFKTYNEFKAVKHFKGKIKKDIKEKISLEDLSYKELQQLCKENDIKVVGKKEDLINELRKKGL